MNFILYCFQPKLNTAGNLAADGDVKEAGLEAETEGAVKDADKKQTVTGELKKLQFYGAGPKAAIPEVLDPGNDTAVTMDMYIIRAMDVIKYSVTATCCQQRWRTNWIHLDIFLGVERRTVGYLVTTNHNKAAVHGLFSQPITAYVGHLCWRLLVATFAVVNGTAVAVTNSSIKNYPPLCK